jgi:hypothetical protein
MKKTIRKCLTAANNVNSALALPVKLESTRICYFLIIFIAAFGLNANPVTGAENKTADSGGQTDGY